MEKVQNAVLLALNDNPKLVDVVSEVLNRWAPQLVSALSKQAQQRD